MNRRASTLVIVIGLSMLMLSLSLAYLVRMRADGQAATSVLHDTQARLMLAAAMAYICETARVGWGQETFGWNDVRDHSPGPRFHDRTLVNGNAEWNLGDPWPAPGAVVRCASHVMERPPYAIQALAAANPIVVVPDGAAIPDGGYRDPANPATTSVTNASGATFTNTHMMADFSRLDPVPAIAGFGEALPLGPGRYADFVDGNRTPRIRTREYGWFRVYRETATDHDGSGTAWYDTVNLNGSDPATPNLSVFVVTVGSGATFGYKNFAEANTSQPGLFVDQQHFDLARASETVYHFRVEWSPYISPMIWNQHRYHSITASSGGLNHHYNDYHIQATGPFGTIRWIQRLDREPPTW